MSSDKCNIVDLKLEFPKKNFQSWTSEGESLLAKHGCDLITVPKKSGSLEHLVGKKLNSDIFLAKGYIHSSSSFDDDKEQWVSDLGKLHQFRHDKVVITGQSGTGTILSLDSASKMIKNLKNLQK